MTKEGGDMSSGLELLEMIKEQFCSECELSMRCMMGRTVDKPIYCSVCQGFVLDDITVQCTCFSQIALGMAEGGLHALPLRGKNFHVTHNCPACRPAGGGRLIKGFVEGRE
jgi:hypothetical protein